MRAPAWCPSILSLATSTAPKATESLATSHHYFLLVKVGRLGAVDVFVPHENLEVPPRMLHTPVVPQHTHHNAAMAMDTLIL